MRPSTLATGFLFFVLPWILFVVGRVQSTQVEQEWQRLDDMPVAVFAARASRSGAKAVVSGGIMQSGLTSNLAQVYDLDRNKWMMLMPLTTGRCQHAQVTFWDGRMAD